MNFGPRLILAVTAGGGQSIQPVGAVAADRTADHNSIVQLSIDNHAITVRPAKSEEIVDLRHRVLRAGLPRSEAIFAGDDLLTSFHFAAVTSDQAVIGCATFHLNLWQSQPAYQLRGMATDPQWVGKGIGKAVLSLGIATIRSESTVNLFWCNGRLIAVPFYEKLGWKIASELFDIPTAGPHHRMVLTND